MFIIILFFVAFQQQLLKMAQLEYGDDLKRCEKVQKGFVVALFVFCAIVPYTRT